MEEEEKSSSQQLQADEFHCGRKLQLSKYWQPNRGLVEA